MPTPSDNETRADWSARIGKAPRSVFGNYAPEEKPSSSAACGTPDPSSNKNLKSATTKTDSLQASIHKAVARSFLYRFLAKAYEDPTREGWLSLAVDCRPSFQAVVTTLGAAAPALIESAARFEATLRPEEFEPFLGAYLALFGHAARGRCPLNEIEYGELKADPLFQPHRLADLAAFYRAFGLEVADDAGERHDHICLELEFMCVLAAREAYALEYQIETEMLEDCRDAQRKFLREHVGRWIPAFARRLAAAAVVPSLRALAELTRVFVESECAALGVTPGSEDLLLRPVDDANDRMCDSCGISNLPPGALAAT